MSRRFNSSRRASSRALAPTLALLFALAFAFAVDAPAQHNVVRVLDGDTLELANGENVRLIGIDTPEGGLRKRKNRPAVRAQPFYLEAKRALTELVDGRDVVLVIDRDPYDRYERRLAYVELTDGVDVQLELLRRGLAMAYAYPPNIARLDSYLRAQDEAMRARRGIWDAPEFAAQTANDNLSLRIGPGRVGGEITSVSETRKYLYFHFGKRFKIGVPRVRWTQFWGEREPQSLIGRRIVAQGRIHANYNKKGKRTSQRMYVRHPSMMQVAE